MSTRMTECVIETGHLEGHDFGPAGRPGDWCSFSGRFSTGQQPKFSVPPCVIVTSILEDDTRVGAFPVCVVREVSRTGFTVAARNSASAGFAALNWIAIQKTPGVVHDVPDVKMGIVPPILFGPAGSHGDQGGVPQPLTETDTTTAAMLLTASDHNVNGHSVPSVGVLKSRFIHRPSSHLAARNSDVVAGGCSFNWASFSYEAFFARDGGNSEPSIEIGETKDTSFQPSGRPGDWQTWDIQFTTPFKESPLILITAKKPKGTPAKLNPAVVGVAQQVTPFGFRLAARNSDCSDGTTGFQWAAIGLPRE